MRGAALVSLEKLDGVLIMSDAACGPLHPVALRGRYVHLLPLSTEHADQLAVAAVDGSLWQLWYTAVPSPAAMQDEIESRLELQSKGISLPFAVIDPASGQAVGMTNYLNIDAIDRRVEIGGTWYAKRVQRTPLNTEAKLLLLAHAFDSLGCIAVEFRTHFFNQQSRRAIERLGAKLDGILRNHKRVADGTLRDTCVYSIIATEWPAVRSHLRWQLERPRDGSPITAL